MEEVRERLVLYLKGIAMGAADVVPGVSGGTIALITGIYERLMFSINRIRLKKLFQVFKGDFSSFKEGVSSIDFQFFVPLGLGITSSFLVLSSVIEFAIDSFTALTYAFFFGLILASAMKIYSRISASEVRLLVSGVLGFFFGFLVVGLPSLQSSHSLPVVFVSGGIAICAMVLPGISGAFLLLVLGQYDYMLSAINNLASRYVDVLVFLAGALVSLFSFAKLLSKLFESYEDITLAFLTGLMLGSLRLPFEKVVSSGLAFNVSSLVPAIFSGLAGAVLVWFLGGLEQ